MSLPENVQTPPSKTECDHALEYNGPCVGGDEYVCKKCGESVDQYVDGCGD